MNNFLQAIGQSVLPPNQWDATLETLQQMVEKAPYAPALQLLLAAKMKETEHPKFEEQWQKTLLYFNNPLLIHHYLFSADAKKEASETPSVETSQLLDSSAESLMSEMPAIPQLKFEKANPAHTEFLFTPYYTVDYFAAQGIKLGEEAPSSDPFGNQLKSFTSWLKQMRRLPEATKNTPFQLNNERVIEKMAENSLHGQNEDTAAMAEVWAKQGNAAKAIKIYQKLSLQNPAKSAYFAAKIDHLKKTIC